MRVLSTIENRKATAELYGEGRRIEDINGTRSNSRSDFKFMNAEKLFKKIQIMNELVYYLEKHYI